MRAEAVDRVKLVFTLFDANGNGYIESEDFEIMARRVLQAAADSDDTARETMLAAFRNYWKALAGLDTNGDGRIAFEEYQALVLSPQQFDETLDDFAEALAALGDPDGDGLIERPLFVALMLAIGFERANIDALFDAFEPNEADQITVATWAAGIKDYYGPDKAGIPGDELVGKAAS